MRLNVKYDISKDYVSGANTASNLGWCFTADNKKINIFS